MLLYVKLLLNSCKNSITTLAMLLTINKLRLNLKLSTCRLSLGVGKGGRTGSNQNDESRFGY